MNLNGLIDDLDLEECNNLYFEYLEKRLPHLTIKKAYYEMTIEERIEWICKDLHILLTPFADEMKSFALVDKEDYMDDLYLLQLNVKTKEQEYLIPYFSLLTYVKALTILEDNIKAPSFWDMALDYHDSYLEACIEVFKLLLEGISTIEG